MHLRYGNIVIADMASEMVNYSKNNILAQAGQSMLAQANQSNQGVLSLLQYLQLLYDLLCKRNLRVPFVVIYIHT